MKINQLFFPAIAALFLLFSLQSCAKRCATCHNTTTADVQQICEQGNFNNKQYRETINNYEDLGYTCLDD